MARKLGSKDKKKRKNRRRLLTAGLVAAGGSGVYLAHRKGLLTKKQTANLVGKATSKKKRVVGLLPPSKNKTLAEKRETFKKEQEYLNKRFIKSKKVKERRKEYLRRILSSEQKKSVDSSYNRRKKLGQQGISRKTQKVIRRRKSK